MSIINNNLSTSNTTMLTVPAATRYAIISIISCNISVSTASLTLYIIPSGQSASNRNLILKAVNIQASDTFTLNAERIVLDAGDSIVAVASADPALNLTISYLEV